MMRHLRISMAGLLCAAAAWAGPADPITLKWNELAPRVLEKTVSLILPSGVAIEGKVRAVEPDRLVLDVGKTSDRRTLAKGLQFIPRSMVAILQLVEHRRAGRIVGTAGMLAAGAAITLAATNSGYSEGILVVAAPAAGAVGTLGLGIGGYYFGKAIDKRVTIIRIAPGE